MNPIEFFGKYILLPLGATLTIACSDGNPLPNKAKIEMKGTTERIEYKAGDKVRFARSTKAKRLSTLLSSTDKINKSFEIKTRARTFIPDYRTKISDSLRTKLTENDSLHIIVQYPRNLNKEELENLKDRGLNLRPLSSKTYVAKVCTQEPLEDILATSSTNPKKLTDFKPEDKLTKFSSNWRDYNHNLDNEGNRVFYVRAWDKEDVEGLANLAKDFGGRVAISNITNSISVSVPDKNAEDFVNYFSNHDKVEVIDLAFPKMQSLNLNSQNVSRFSMVEQTFPEVNGEGESVCVYDGGYADCTIPGLEGHCETMTDSTYVAAHPTHVTYTIGGTGVDTIEFLQQTCNASSIAETFNAICELFHLYQQEGKLDLLKNAFAGKAPKVHVYSENYGRCEPYCIYETPNKTLETYTICSDEHGVAGINNSIGTNASLNGYDCRINGAYDEGMAYLVDKFIRGGFGNRPTVVVFAAGNERFCCWSWASHRCYQEGDEVGWGTIGGGPASGKNTIVVGAIAFDESGNLVDAHYSSIGPTHAGRAPTLVDFGGDFTQRVISGATELDGGFMGMMGSSMATPNVTGPVVTTTQTIHDLYEMDPLPSTIKAILVNSAIDMGNPYVDYIFGFGRNDDLNSQHTVRDGRFLEDKLETGDVKKFYVYHDGVGELKVTMSYSDEPGEDLVNDLDLSLISPDGDVYHPHVLDPENPAEEATRREDRVNTTEQVYVKDSELETPGVWTVEVQGYDVPSGEQDFSVAYSHPKVEVEGGRITNTGNGDITGMLRANVQQATCSAYYKTCFWRDVEWLLNGYEGDTTIPAKGSLELADVVPEYTATKAGSYRLCVEMHDEDHNIVLDSEGNAVHMCTPFKVNE